MSQNELTINLEAVKLDTLLKVIQHLASNELKLFLKPKLTLKFGGVGSVELDELVGQVETYLETQHQVKSKITAKSTHEVYAPPPPPTPQPEPMNMFIVRPRPSEERN
jgi:hypothetical protein